MPRQSVYEQDHVAPRKRCKWGSKMCFSSGQVSRGIHLSADDEAGWRSVKHLRLLAHSAMPDGVGGEH